MLEPWRDREPVVLALPRGGVVVGAEIAEALDAPLDVLVVRKIPAPRQPELALGAVTDGSEPRSVLNHSIIASLGVPRRYLEQAIAEQLEEVRRREATYRQGRSAVSLTGRHVIVVDDGIATGATVQAGLKALRHVDPATLVLAVPVGPQETLEDLGHHVDELVYLLAPDGFRSVGGCYDDFEQVTDREVVELLRQAAG